MSRNNLMTDMICPYHGKTDRLIHLVTLKDPLDMDGVLVFFIPTDIATKIIGST